MLTHLKCGAGFSLATAVKVALGLVTGNRLVLALLVITGLNAWGYAQDARVEKAFKKEGLKYEVTETGRYKLIYQTEVIVPRSFS